MLWVQLIGFTESVFYLMEETNCFVFCPPPPQLSPDWGIDYESYDWRQIDPNSEECKTMVKEYFLWEGEFKHVGNTFNQGKIFKWGAEGAGTSTQNLWTHT